VDVPEAAKKVEDRERITIDVCNSPEFTLDKLKALF
jgi:hypothetical protein